MIVQAFAATQSAVLPLLFTDVTHLGPVAATNNRYRSLPSFSRLLAAPLDTIFDDPNSDAIQGTLGTEPKRRVRYNGKFPRNFGDKYKELAGDEATVQKVLSKGMTPAGRHVPILLNECFHHLGLLNITTTTTPTFYVDCTLGYGGHSSQVLRRLMDNKENRMVCFDRDPEELIKATHRLKQIIEEHQSDTNILTTVESNFRRVRSFLQQDTGKVTALLADLGLSSMQIDNAARGFTYKREGPLDMRMAGNSTSESAFDLLSRITVKQFTKMLEENSDEVYAGVIAQAVLGNSSNKKKQSSANIPSTTVELANVVRDAVRPLISPKPSDLLQRDSPKVKKELDSTVARVMQAIRIAVNEEFESLDELLDDLPILLAPGGRAVFLTFHSGEDRRVKNAFKTGFKDGIYSSWSRDVVRPTATERRDNPRSSCCKLRWVVRSDIPAVATVSNSHNNP